MHNQVKSQQYFAVRRTKRIVVFLASLRRDGPFNYHKLGSALIVIF